MPSVTEILDAVGLRQNYRWATQEQRVNALKRGQAMHRIIELYHLGRLDIESVHPDLQAPFAAYLEFVEDVGHIPMYSELELIHEPFRFCGHLDRVGTVRAKSGVIDWTLADSPDLPGKLYQVAGYRLLWDYAHPEQPSECGYVVSLTKSGRYHLHKQGDHEAQVFLAAVIVYHAREAKR